MTNMLSHLCFVVIWVSFHVNKGLIDFHMSPDIPGSLVKCGLIWPCVVWLLAQVRCGQVSSDTCSDVSTSHVLALLITQLLRCQCQQTAKMQSTCRLDFTQVSTFYTLSHLPGKYTLHSPCRWLPAFPGMNSTGIPVASGGCVLKWHNTDSHNFYNRNVGYNDDLVITELGHVYITGCWCLSSREFTHGVPDFQELICNHSKKS